MAGNAKETRGAGGVAYWLVAAAIFVSTGILVLALVTTAIALFPFGIILLAGLGIGAFILLSVAQQSRDNPEDRYYSENIDE